MGKEPWLDAAAVRVRVQGRVGTLEGLVSSPEHSRMAEQDPSYVLGLHNRLQVGDAARRSTTRTRGVLWNTST